MSKHTYKVKYRSIEFDIEFEYTPEDPMVMYYPDGSGYPGSPPEVEIQSIFHKGTDFTEFFEEEYDKIETLILEKIEGTDESRGEEDS